MKKKFKVVEELTLDQEMCSEFIKASEITSMRIAIHDNDFKSTPKYEKNRYVAEVDLNFENGSDIKLRQNLGTWRNHCYKIPKPGPDLDFAEWYDGIYAQAKKLDSSNTAVHGKLGKRMRNPDNPKQKKYFNVPGVFITYDYATNKASLFVTEPILDKDDKVNFWEEHIELLEIELNKESVYDDTKKLRWVHIEFGGDEE